jgi:hypothetical protein
MTSILRGKKDFVNKKDGKKTEEFYFYGDKFLGKITKAKVCLTFGMVSPTGIEPVTISLKDRYGAYLGNFSNLLFLNCYSR